MNCQHFYQNYLHYLQDFGYAWNLSPNRDIFRRPKLQALEVTTRVTELDVMDCDIRCYFAPKMQVADDRIIYSVMSFQEGEIYYFLTWEFLVAMVLLRGLSNCF